jgi:uncharacterized delta-60 repeat protein
MGGEEILMTPFQRRLSPPSRVVLAAAILLAEPLCAADGDFDLGFFGSGQHVIEGEQGLYGSTVVAAPDGRVVIAGGELNLSGGSDVVWYAVSDGAVSSPCHLPAPGGSLSVGVSDAIFDGQGRLLLVGDHSPAGGNRLLLARYLYPACTLDPGFDGNGILDLNLPSGPIGDFANAVALHPTTGWIAVTGEVDPVSPTGVATAFVVLMTDAGVPITAFGGDGVVEITPTGDPDEISIGNAIAFAPANRIVVGGEADHEAGANTDFFVARLELDGDLDPGFGTGGFARIAFDLVEDGFDGLRDLAVDPSSGALVAAGELESGDGNQVGVARLTAAGIPDSSFSGDGRWADNPCASDESGASALAVDGLGRSVATGYCQNPDGSVYFALRLSESGGLDPTFGGDGWAQIPFGDGDYLLETDVALSAGRVVFAGTFDSQFALTRLENDLIFADSFEVSPFSTWSSVNGML